MGYYMDQYFRPRSSWIRLEKWLESNVPGVAEHSGVYEIAHNVSVHEPVDNRDIMYIGEAHDGTLGTRVYYFGREAVGKSGPHSGGRKFHAKGWQRENAWVRLYPLPPNVCPPERAGALAQLLERELIWDFCCNSGGQPPVLNDH